MPKNSVDVLITLPFDATLVGKLQAVSPRLRISVHPAQKAEDIPAEVWNRCEVLYTAMVLPAPEKAPNLRWIQFHYAGVDKSIGSPLLSNPEIIVTTLSGASVSQMSEYILMMLLSLGHKLPAMVASQRKSEWLKDRWERFSPVELRGKTIGIIGYGSVGRQVARLLQSFGATVLATKSDAMHPIDTGYTPEGMGDTDGDLVHRLYPAEAAVSMVKACDFVVVTVPLTPATRGLVNSELLSAMKPSAYLVDVSRGGIVDHSALIKALQDGKLSGAALDVFPEEPLPASSPFWQMPNVILTPHISGNSPFYDQRAMDLFAENLQRYLAGSMPHNLFDPTKGY